MSSKWPGIRKPIIIALDQDNFYCGVERVLNPDLRNKPVGITQKSLLATISYEGRAMGVSKLMSIRKALEICPQMILVDGEDLTNYRRFSRAVAALVNAIVGGNENSGGVEKLGMDEVFLDVTDLAYDHVEQTLGIGVVSTITTRFFRLPSTAQVMLPVAAACGFSYSTSDIPGYILEPVIIDLADPLDPHHQALLAAGQLANFIRKSIKEIIGLTSSGGIARNKLLAKLVANVKKPDGQTTFLAEPGVKIGDQHQDMVQKFLDPMEIRKLNGFGSKIVGDIASHLKLKGIPVEGGITVAQCRMIDQTVFEHLFRGRPSLSTHLWGLLHGIDVTPVVPSPSYPKQISVEDSYARTMKRSFRTISEQMQSLMASLIIRLEEELMEERDSQPLWTLLRPVSTKSRQWKRFPKQFRLSLRLEWETHPGRESKSVPMPAFICDINRPVNNRAEMLCSKLGFGLLKELLGVRKGDKVDEDTEFAVYVINVAALALSPEPPPPSVFDEWTTSSHVASKRKNILAREMTKRPMDTFGSTLTQAIEIDFDASPPTEVIEIPSTPIERPVKKLRKTERETTYMGTRPDAQNDTDARNDRAYEPQNSSTTKKRPETKQSNLEFETIDESDDDESFETADAEEATCQICKVSLFPFALEAHLRWHQSEEDAQKHTV